METPKYAVIDLGTNTFTLLIAAPSTRAPFQAIFHDRVYVRLADDGIQTIGAEPYARAMDAMQRFRAQLDDFGVSQIYALGTAALRTATNGADLVRQIEEKTNITVSVIDGNQEANFIYEGVSNAYPFDGENDVIMDIGGGSVEFIIANKTGKIWAQSFPVGVAVLKRLFHREEPIVTHEINAIHTHLTTTLAPLLEACAKNPVRNLIGASGTFDVLENIYVRERISPIAAMMDIAQVKEFHDKVIQATPAQRSAMHRVPDSRVEMIVVAMVLIQFIINVLNIKAVGVSSYAMKEGLMCRLVKQNDL